MAEELSPEQGEALAAQLMDEATFSKFWEGIKALIPEEDREGCRLVAQAAWECSRSTAIGIPMELLLERLMKKAGGPG